ncbi:hypothetical protein VCV18_007354 [Metarhizium anisopliae]
MAAKYTKPKAQYSRLPGEDKSLFQSDNDGTEFDIGQVTVRLKKRLLISTICNAISLILFIGIGVARLHDSRPIHDQLDLEPSIQKINGTLFPSNAPSMARELPNPAADQVWEEWELTRVFPITKDQVIKMGKDPAYTAKLEDDIWGLGDDAYAGVLDVYHQLHCLNSLRQIAYGAYYNASTVNPKVARLPEIHVNHCVDILMQALQCSGNVNIITLDWVETQTYPFPDMSVNRQCVNFERLTAWRKENTIDMDKYIQVMKKPKGVRGRPMADQFYAYHNLDNPNHLHGANLDQDFNV